MYYVYIIKNKKNDKLYIGYTSNLERRLQEHGKNFEQIYHESFKSKRDARERERKLKQYGQSIRWLKQRLKNSLA